MRQPSFKDSVVMHQREINFAEQQDISGHPRMAGFEGIRPNLALDSPRWEIFLQTSRLDVVTVLWSIVWLQQDLHTMHAAAKKRFRNSRPGGLFLLLKMDYV